MTDLVRFMSDEEKVAASGGFKTAEQGAATSVWCATSSQLNGRGGVYCLDVDIAEVVPPMPARTEPSDRRVFPWAIDPDLAERLWQVSEEMTDIMFRA